MRASVRCSVTLLRGNFQKIREYCREDARNRVCTDLTTPSHEPPGRPFHDTAQAASNLTISSLLSVCWFAIYSVAVCTCGGYTAQASLIDFCLCLLKVVSAAVYMWWGFVQDVMC